MVNSERHHGADLAKWLGLVLMVLDHAWHIVPAEWQDIYGYVRVPGRLAFPIFCCVIAINVIRSAPGDLGSFKRNLVGLLGFEAMSIAALHWNWPGGAELTVLATLAGGLVIAAAIHHGTVVLGRGGRCCPPFLWPFSRQAKRAPLNLGCCGSPP